MQKTLFASMVIVIVVLALMVPSAKADNDDDDGDFSFCSLGPVTGECRAFIRKYFYNSTTGTCQQFTYGGCKGNANRFDDLQQCESVCKYHRLATRNAPHCEAAPDPGQCEASMPMFYYDPASSQCNQFNYGGCGGNSNRFTTYQACMASCSYRVDCNKPSETGNCQAYQKRFFFEAESGQCKEFTYGGCGGNLNRFKTNDECMAICGPSYHSTAAIVNAATTLTMLSLLLLLLSVV